MTHEQAQAIASNPQAYGRDALEDAMELLVAISIKAKQRRLTIKQYVKQLEGQG